MRYFIAFTITILVYSLFFGIYYYLNIEEKVKIVPKPSVQEVKFTIISPEPPQKRIEPKKEVVKKVEPKKVEPKKEVIKKVEPKKVEIKKEVVEKVEPKKIEPKKEITKAVKEQKYIPQTQIKKDESKKIKETLKQKYFSKIKDSINRNKIYPKRAIKRNMQGDVKVKFTISKYGELLNIDILDGKTIFYKSVKTAIQNSFPIIPDDGLFSKEIELDLMITYRLN